MTLDAKLITEVPEAPAMPQDGQDGYLTLALVTPTANNFQYAPVPELFFLGPKRGADLALTGDVTINVTQGNHRVIPEGSVVGDRVITLSVTGATTNETLVMTRLDTSDNLITVIGASSTTLPAGQRRSQRFRFFSGSWSPLRHWSV